jgi:D-alanyl-lipoteichoic acid acyltransferase DltB (MBOAT superfamily)
VSKGRNYFNLFFTFFVSGIWHGANYTFMVWGALHGMFLMILKYFGIGKTQNSKFSLLIFIRIIFTFLLVTYAWVFFRANSISDAWLIHQKLFNISDGFLFVRWEVFFTAIIALTILFLKEVSNEFLPTKYTLLENPNSLVRLFNYVMLTSVIILFGVFNSGQFIYFQF